MTTFRVFVGAPSYRAIQEQSEGCAYKWHTVSSTAVQALFPPATLEAASRRISLLYQNIIFNDDEGDGITYDDDRDSTLLKDPSNSSIFWPPTGPPQISYGPIVSFLEDSVSHAQTTALTDETQDTTSYDYSDASSIARFPAFHFNLHALTSLSALATNPASSKLSFLLAILEVEGPDAIRIKKGPDAGKEVSILKLIMGDADSQICKLTAWREVAEAWGGCGDLPAVKRGDVVWVENVRASCEGLSAIALTASPFLRSTLEICYRTMPYTHEDNRLRPDLRLGASDAGVKKVEALVKWFEEMAGLS